MGDAIKKRTNADSRIQRFVENFINLLKERQSLGSAKTEIKKLVKSLLI